MAQNGGFLFARNMSAGTQGSPPMFPDPKTPWPSCDGVEGVPIRAAAKTPWNAPTASIMQPGETRRGR